MHQVSIVCCVFFLLLLSISEFSNDDGDGGGGGGGLTFYAYVYFTFWTFVNFLNISVRLCAPLYFFERKKLFDSRFQAVQILRFVSLSAFLLNKLNVHSEVTFKQLMRLSSYNRDRTTTTTTKKS